MSIASRIAKSSALIHQVGHLEEDLGAAKRGRSASIPQPTPTSLVRKNRLEIKEDSAFRKGDPQGANLDKLSRHSGDRPQDRVRPQASHPVDVARARARQLTNAHQRRNPGTDDRSDRKH
jgi:hypothetical protein